MENNLSSFDEAILDEPERFIGYAFEENPTLSDFGEFSKALEDGIKVPKGEISEQTKIDLFENRETSRRIRGNVSDEEYDKLYGDGLIVKREVIGTKVITIAQPKIKSKGYITRRTPKPVSAYERGKPIRFTPAEIKFLQVRKIKKITPKQIIAQYDTHFKIKRTKSSLSSKIYRI